MGSSFELGVIWSNDRDANKLLDEGIEEIIRLENLLSEFKTESYISQINQYAGIKPVSVDKEVFDLLARSLMISRITNGYFDISVGPLKKLYRFKNSDFVLPSKKEINNTLNLTGYNKIVLNETEHSVFLKQKDMHISLAAIGKGFAADKVKKMWTEKGVTSGYVNASGDLTSMGLNENNEPWKVSITHPDDRNQNLLMIPLTKGSVATSGDSEQHFIHKGKRYSHNINPKTGMPLSGIRSVSVFSVSAELADALATAIYSMGVPEGLRFVDHMPNTHVIMIDDKNKIHFSKNLKYEAVG